MEKKCKDEVAESFKERMADIRKLYKLYCDGEDESDPDLGILDDYGLCIDKVEAGTFKNQREDYFRYQLSWGGPQEEFRIYKNGDVEFWFLNWFDEACVDVEGEDADIIKSIVGPAFPDERVFKEYC